MPNILVDTMEIRSYSFCVQWCGLEWWLVKLGPTPFPLPLQGSIYFHFFYRSEGRKLQFADPHLKDHKPILETWQGLNGSFPYEANTTLSSMTSISDQTDSVANYEQNWRQKAFEQYPGNNLPEWSNKPGPGDFTFLPILILLGHTTSGFNANLYYKLNLWHRLNLSFRLKSNEWCWQSWQLPKKVQEASWWA